MLDSQPSVGRVVISKMGRDKGKAFMVVAVVSQDFVLIADGKFRKLSAPKLKRYKHLTPVDASLELIANKLAENKKVFDSELASSLREFFQ